MLLGFRRRFAPFVEEGSKTHTIRAKRKRPPRVGETCHCYVDPRQKTMRLLGRWACVRVEDIRITVFRHAYANIGRVWIEGIELSLDEANALAWRDGFRGHGTSEAFAEMVSYWMKLHPEVRRGCQYDFRGDVIHWRYTAAKAAAA